MAPSAIKRAPLTHFLCLPLTNPASQPQLQASLKKFCEATGGQGQLDINGTSSASDGVGKRNDDVGTIHPQAIRPSGTLHLTLGVMSLSSSELEHAVALLKSLTLSRLLGEQRSGLSTASAEQSNEYSTISRQLEPTTVERPVEVKLQGLESMHPPQQTSILYCTPLDATARLRPLCLAVQNIFRQQGYLVPDDRPLKLHATIVNTIYVRGRKRPSKIGGSKKMPLVASAKPSNPFAPPTIPEDDQQVHVEGHGPKANAPLKIDARSLLEAFDEFVWAENITLDRLAICEMGAKKIMDGQGNVVNEAYTEVASVSLLPSL